MKFIKKVDEKGDATYIIEEEITKTNRTTVSVEKLEKQLEDLRKEKERIEKILKDLKQFKNDHNS